MDEEGNCRICYEKCNWIVYKNVKYFIKYVIKFVKKIYVEMKERYEGVLERKFMYE